MRNCLLVNDDGPQSPVLLPFARALESAGVAESLTIVVPAEERSWISQAVTRFNSVFLTEMTLESRLVYAISGTPADCADIGLFQLSPDIPELCISGINIGSNAGWPYFSNSGTIGGARQAALSGVPALAFSVQVPGPVFLNWAKRDSEAGVDRRRWESLASVAAGLCNKLVHVNFWEVCEFCSINLPYECDSASPVEITSLDNCRYERLFKRIDARTFRHSGVANFRNVGRSIGSDIEALERGCVSITPIASSAGEDSAIQRLQARFAQASS